MICPKKKNTLSLFSKFRACFKYDVSKSPETIVQVVIRSKYLQDYLTTSAQKASWSLQMCVCVFVRAPVRAAPNQCSPGMLEPQTGRGKEMVHQAFSVIVFTFSVKNAG